MSSTRTLLLLRHGKSDWHAGAAGDFSRPLSKRGAKTSSRIGKWLHDNELLPDYIISSPATRAYKTAEHVCAVTGMSGSVPGTDERLYLADVSGLLDVIRECPHAAGSLMIVGHNPGLEELLAYLCTDPVAEPENGKLMPTATLAVLGFNCAWNGLGKGSARLQALISPRQLGD